MRGLPAAALVPVQGDLGAKRAAPGLEADVPERALVELDEPRARGAPPADRRAFVVQPQPGGKHRAEDGAHQSLPVRTALRRARSPRRSSMYSAMRRASLRCKARARRSMNLSTVLIAIPFASKRCSG